MKTCTTVGPANHFHRPGVRRSCIGGTCSLRAGELERFDTSGEVLGKFGVRRLRSETLGLACECHLCVRGQGPDETHSKAPDAMSTRTPGDSRVGWRPRADRAGWTPAGRSVQPAARSAVVSGSSKRTGATSVRRHCAGGNEHVRALGQLTRTISLFAATRIRLRRPMNRDPATDALESSR
jgi:hypothetical protein